MADYHVNPYLQDPNAYLYPDAEAEKRRLEAAAAEAQGRAVRPLNTGLPQANPLAGFQVGNIRSPGAERYNDAVNAKLQAAANRAYDFRDAQQSAAQMYADAARGVGPSVAREQWMMGLGDAQANAARVAGRAGPLGGMRATLGGMGGVNAAGAAGRADEVAKAYGSQAGMLGSIRGGDLGQINQALDAQKFSTGIQGEQLDWRDKVALANEAHRAGINKAALEGAMRAAGNRADNYFTAKEIEQGIYDNEREQSNRIWNAGMKMGSDAAAVATPYAASKLKDATKKYDPYDPGY